MQRIAAQGRAGPDQARAGNPTGGAGQGRGGPGACASNARPAPCCCCCLAAGCPRDMGPLPALLWPAPHCRAPAFNSAAAPSPCGQAAARKRPRCCLLSLAIRRSGLQALVGLQAIVPMALRRKPCDCFSFFGGVKGIVKLMCHCFFGPCWANPRAHGTFKSTGSRRTC